MSVRFILLLVTWPMCIGFGTETVDPASGRVRFYLLTYSGVRVLDTDLASIESGRSKYTSYFGRAQDVLTELRLISENQ